MVTASLNLMILLNFIFIANAQINSVNGVISFQLTRTTPSNISDLAKRRVQIQALWRRRFTHKMEFSLGTPPQHLEALLDTGSGEFIVTSINANNLEFLFKDPVPFDETFSTTFTRNGSDFFIKYHSGSYSGGYWAQDIFSNYNIRIPNFKFGLADYSSHKFTIGGVGFPTNNFPHTNFPMQLKECGAISRIVYSIWLNGKRESLGYVIFGGIDRSLIGSDLYRFPVVNSMKGARDHLAIKLQEIYYIKDRKNHELLAQTSLPIIFDTGVAVSRLPQRILDKLYTTLNAMKHNKYWVVPCYHLHNGGSVSLVFSGVEFIFPLHDIAVLADRELELCVPGFLPSDIPIIGENVLKLLYLVCDLENFEIGLALARIGEVAYNMDPDISAIRSTIMGTKAPGYSHSEIKYRITAYDIDLTSGSHRFHRASATTSKRKKNILVGHLTDMGVLPTVVPRYDEL